MTTFSPALRAGIDWDDDWFICYDAQRNDPLNRMHTGLSSDPNLVNLHWNYVNKSGTGGATLPTFSQTQTSYGLRIMNCITGNNPVGAGGGYLGRTGSTNDFTVVNGDTYTASCWLKASVNPGVEFLFSMENGAGSKTITVTADWQRIDHTFTASSTTTAFKIIKNGSTTNVTFQATGFMIVAGTRAPFGFNVGDASNLYDNITDDLLSVNWKLGRNSWTNTIFDEGDASFQLRNDSRTYMPENALSPLYGKMEQRRLVTIEAHAPNVTTWTRLFTGWTATPEVNLASTTGQLTTTIPCTQGKFQLDSIQYNKPVSGTQTADEVIRSVILSGFTSAATPYQVILNTAKLNACYFVDPDVIMDLDTGVSDIPTTGEGWGGDVNASRVIDDVMRIERGFVFIDRSGVVKFFNRHHYFDPALAPSETTINLDTDATTRSYTYGANYQNVVRVTYRPSGENSGVIWQSQEPIAVEAGETKTVDVKFERQQSGQKITVSEITAFGDADPSSTYTTLPAYTKAKTNITYELNNGRAKLTVFNYSRQLVKFTIVLRGSLVESYGGATVERSGDVRGGKITMSIDSRQLTEENDAINLGDYMLGIHDDAVGQFNGFTIKSKNATWFDRMMSITLGTKLSISETQTGHNQNYYVCGESGSWMPGEELDISYQLFPLFRIQSPWILGTSVLGTSTYLGY